MSAELQFSLRENNFSQEKANDLEINVNQGADNYNQKVNEAEQNQSQSSSLWQEFRRRIVWYQIYFLVYILINVVFVAYYIALAFKQRDSCTFDTTK